jgi:hypothetical protein
MPQDGGAVVSKLKYRPDLAARANAEQRMDDHFCLLQVIELPF